MISRIISRIKPFFHPLPALGRLARFFLCAAAAFHVLLFLWIMAACGILARRNPSSTSLMTYRAVTTGGRARELRFVPLQRIPRSVQLMFIELEDKKFYTHPGIDPAAILDAYRVNASVGYALYGGSTITQQLARTLFLTPRKTYFRKYVEALIAVEMELFLKKQRILELYLNYIEWGKGVYGIGAASVAAYGRPFAELTVDEFRRLAAIIPNPLRFTTDTFFNSRQMTERYDRLIVRFPDPDQAVIPGEESG
jgi:monofunctional biosynthetic peptidoglycan transglycosylase